MRLIQKDKSFIRCCLILICASASLFSQAPDTVWTKTFGGIFEETGKSVQQTADGGFIMTGATESFGAGSWDVLLIRTDSAGDTLWIKTYGDSGVDWANSVQQTADGGFIIAGYTNSTGAGGTDVLLIRTNANGHILWRKTYGGSGSEIAESVEPTADGGYIVIGYTTSFGAGSTDIFFIRADSVGDTLWTRTFGTAGNEKGNDVQQTADGGFIITGFTGAGFSDVWLIRTDTNGDTLWTKTFGGNDVENGYSVRETNDGGFIITGSTASFGAGGYDVLLIRTNQMGNRIWTKTFGGSEWDVGYAVRQVVDGGYIIAGYTNSFGSGNSDLWLIRTDASGGTLWMKTLGGINGESGFSVQPLSDGGYIISGYTNSFGSGDDDVWLIRLAPDNPTAIGDNPPAAPATFRLLQNYPNPFNPSTKVEFQIPNSEFVILTVYDLLGREVKTLVSEHLSAGYHTAHWDGRNNAGRPMSSGVYLYRLDAGEFSRVRKMVLMQ